MLATSWLRRLLVTAAAALTFVLLYEVSTLDSQYAKRQAYLREGIAAPAPGGRVRFKATAYCKGTVTASGTTVRSGIAAADPSLLAVGSVVQVDTPIERHNGIYTIMDTGPQVRGREVDLYMWNCHEAVAFGRKDVTLTVLRLGWNPTNTSPNLVDFFLRREPQPVPRVPARQFDVQGFQDPPTRLPAVPVPGSTGR
jgi:3D (Asp-Asp-Asp) domain-containing protein